MAISEELRLIEEITSNVDAVQERVLAEILERNAGAEYLKKCGLDAGSTDRSNFRAKVPVISYADLWPYLERIANGDRSPILTSTRPVSEFFTSSGTSGGQRKLTPSVDDEHDRRRLLNGLIMPVMKSHFPGIEHGKGLYFMFARPPTKTPGGLVSQPGLSSYYRSKKHFDDHGYTSPMEAILCEDTSQSMYAQMLCGLCQRHDVVRLGAVFAAVLLRSIQFLQLNWEQLAADIEHGELSARVAEPSVRQAVARVLGRPDPGLARFVRDECSKGDWAGIVARIWPNTRYVDVILTGAMAQYVPTLRHYVGGGVPLVSTKYTSSECNLGINLNPLCDPSEVSYTIMPNMGYFEFLPLADGLEPSTAAASTTTTEDQLVELARVEAGREYELVVTTHAGLSRYRVGDVLQVTGFHNAAPQFRFVRRENVVLSVEFDKTDEAELQRAVGLASELLLRTHGASVAEYTAQACTKRIPGHYVVYWELLLTDDADPVDAVRNKEVMDSCCLQMEEALGFVYRHARADGGIGPLEIRVVRQGTFAELMDDAVSRGASMNQYKVPRCVTLPPVIDLLDSRPASSPPTSAPHCRITPIDLFLAPTV